MTWHYVVARERLATGEDHFTIREFYTESDHGGVGWTEDPIEAAGETYLEIVHTLSRMLSDAASRQVLDLTLDPPRLVNRDEL